MLNDALSKVVGTPLEGVTHWGIGRSQNGRVTRLDYPGEGGVRVNTWPLEELSLDEIRARWGSGSFKVLWLHPDNPDPKRKSGGWSPLFTLDPETSVHVAAPAPAATVPVPSMPIAAQPGGVSAGDLLNVMTTMMQLSDKRSDSILTAVMNMAASRRDDAPTRSAEVSDEMSQLRAELAATNARLDAEKRERELADKHREEMRKKDEEIAELRRAKEEAEREAEREATPRIEPGTPLMTQLGYGLMNAAMAKPELVGKVVEAAAPLVEKLMGGGAAPTPPQAPPPPTGVPAPRPMPPVVRARPSVEPEVTVAPSKPVNGADPANSSWQPIGNGEKTPAPEAEATG